jgi:hypothetical protein
VVDANKFENGKRHTISTKNTSALQLTSLMICIAKATKNKYCVVNGARQIKATDKKSDIK